MDESWQYDAGFDVRRAPVRFAAVDTYHRMFALVYAVSSKDIPKDGEQQAFMMRPGYAWKYVLDREKSFVMFPVKLLKT